ncbi:MAG: nickel-dependent lactate racemase [Armatimonadota bacterium]|jgi:nickel-dependent lactate racemase
MKAHLRYGKQGLDVELPDQHVAGVLRLTPLPVIEAPAAAVRDGLAAPIGAPPLRELATGKSSVCILVSDITRPVPNTVIVPPVLECLQAAGVPESAITILVATGLHRPSTPDELREMLGDDIADGSLRIVSHEGRDADGHVDLGTTQRGTPVQLDRRWLAADLRIATGLIEPHLMAGYSGGRKAICPGVASLETIKAFHGPGLLEPEESRAGNLADNPCHAECVAAAERAPAHFIVNVTLDDRRRVTGVFAGDMHEAWEAGARHCERGATSAIAEPADIVLTTSAGHPLDLTYYQSVKGMIQAVPVLKPGGTLIIAAECAEGIGGPEYTELMLNLDDPEKFVADSYDPANFVIDQWQLHELVKCRRSAEVFCFSEGIPPDVLSQLFVTPIDSVEQGVERALAKHGRDAAIAVIPDGPYVLPVIA